MVGPGRHLASLRHWVYVQERLLFHSRIHSPSLHASVDSDDPSHCLPAGQSRVRDRVPSPQVVLHVPHDPHADHVPERNVLHFGKKAVRLQAMFRQLMFAQFQKS